MAKVAVVKLSSLGDIVHALAVLNQISQEHELYWIVDSSFAGVLKRAGDIKIVELRVRELKKTKSVKVIKETLSTLKNLPKFDIVIDIQGLLKSALIAKLLKAGELWGFDRASCKESIASLFYTHRVNIPYDEHILKRNCHLLLHALKEELNPEDITPPFLFPSSKSSQKDAILIAIGSSKEDKRYPKERVLEFIEMVNKDVYLIAYTQKEIEEANFIVEHSKAKLLPKMSLESLVDKISEFRYLVGVDSGVAYISWALGVKTIILYGPTKPDRFAPKSSNIVTIQAKSMADIEPLSIYKEVE